MKIDLLKLSITVNFSADLLSQIENVDILVLPVADLVLQYRHEIVHQRLFVCRA